MTHPDQRDREFEELEERLERLGEASLRISESLEFDAVLQGVLDSARSLTASRYGVMTLLDERGLVQDFLSSGTTAEEAERLWLTPDSDQIFEALTDLSEPLRVADVVEHVRSLGFAEFKIPVPVDVFRLLAAPMFCRGERVGHVFVGDKDGGAEFTRADEEVLVMFASQAALVIDNARRHRDEQRARADLETLVNTSPVGVVVFDAVTGEMGLVNREAVRIVEGLREADQSLEELLEGVTCVRASGREVSLQGMPLSDFLGAGEVIRAEEIELRVPDGRSVGALLNTSPIRSDDGAVVSFVVTLQDMAPLDEQERLGGVLGHGEPRAAHAPRRGHRVGGHAVGHRRRAGLRRDHAVPPHHPRPVRPDAPPDRRPVGRGPHQHGQPSGRPRALRGASVGRRCQDQIPRRGRRQPLERGAGR